MNIITNDKDGKPKIKLDDQLHDEYLEDIGSSLAPKNRDRDIDLSDWGRRQAEKLQNSLLREWCYETYGTFMSEISHEDMYWICSGKIG